jgi:hypothetical protein
MMSNMSYCRFQNTSKDLRACRDALLELFEGGSDDGDPALSRDELEAAQDLVATCLEIAGILADEASIDLDTDALERGAPELLGTANAYAEKHQAAMRRGGR